MTAPKRTRLRRADRYRQLLQHAITACATHGIARVTHSQVAEAAGVSTPTVFSYFGNRQVLVDAVVGEVESMLLGLIEEPMRSAGSAGDKFRSVAREFTDAAQQSPDLFKVWLDWSTGVENVVWPRYLEVLARIHRAYSGAIRRAQRSGELSPSLSPITASRLYAGGGHTVVLMQFAGTSRRQINQFIEHLVRGTLGLPAD